MNAPVEQREAASQPPAQRAETVDAQKNTESALKERAEAAEKTVRVLKERVRELLDGESTSHLQRQLARSQKRSDEVARRRELAELRNRELQRYSTSLELEVRNRTADLHAILDNVDSGFLLVDADMVVQPGHSRSCSALLGASELAGKVLTRLLGASSATEAWLRLAVAQAFADELPEDVALAQIPARHAVGNRTLRLVPRVIRDCGRVVRLLITLNDATALESAQRESRTNQMLVGILAQREAFDLFVDDARAEIASARASLLEQPLLRRVVHTLKGNSASWGIESIVDVCHRVEESELLVATDIDSVDDAFAAFFKQHDKVLNVAWRQDATYGHYAVGEAQLIELDEIVRDGGEQRDHLASWKEKLVLKRATDVVGPLPSFMERLAARLDKAVDFELKGGETLIDARRLRPLVAVLPHLLRNAVDHGIELADERGAKPARARVTLEVSERDDAWCFAVSDDGRGIDTVALKARAVHMAVLGGMATKQLDRAQLLQLIFVDGLSTAPVANEVSGRGTGMSAILAVVERLGGRVDVQSTDGEGTSITLTIPRDTPARAAA